MTDPWISLYAAPAAVGFALTFNVRGRALLPIAVLAVIAHLLRSLLEGQGISLVGASFAAAFVIGAAAYVLGPATGEASPVYSFAPVIPLVPGSLLFSGLEGLAVLITERVPGTEPVPFAVGALDDLLTAAAVVLALALGSTAPSLMRLRSRRPVAEVAEGQ